MRLTGTHATVPPRADEAAGRSGQGLRVIEQPDLLRRFLEVCPDLLWVTDHAGHLLAVGGAWPTLLGWSREELIGRPLIDLLHPEDAEAAREVLATVAAGEPLEGFEARIAHRDGSHR